MIDLAQVQTELSCARAARIAVETVGDEIEALVLDMQNHAWHRIALSLRRDLRSALVQAAELAFIAGRGAPRP